MGTVFTALLLALLAVAVYFAGRSIRRRKGCGGHCAPLMHEALGTKENGLVRVSFSHFNRKEEVNALIRALRAF